MTNYDMIGERVESLACSKCDTVMDVSQAEPFSIIECPNCGTQLSVPKRLGNFILLRFLGRGGMGAVFQGFDAKLGRQVAIKVLGDVLGGDSGAMDNFLREARAAAQITSANVVSIYQVGEDKGVPFIVMELISGGQLDKMIETEPLSELQALEVCRHAAHGLSAAQEIGLFHGDIKPENILFDQHGIAKIADFGLAQFLQRGKKSKPGEIWGTPYYIAPEKARRQQEDYRSDIYSLGATLFHALTGQPPFEGETAAEVVLARLRQLPPDIREIKPELHQETAEMVARMLDPDPMSRYPNYTSLLSDLVRVIDTVKRDKESSGKGGKKRKKSLWIIILLILIGIGASLPFILDKGPTVFSEEQDIALTSHIHRWAKNRYRYDLTTLNSFNENLTSYQKNLPKDHDGTLWIEVIQGSVEALAMQTNAMNTTFEALAAKKIPQMRDDNLNPAYMPVDTARFFLSSNEIYTVDTRIYPGWYKDLSLYFIAIKYLSNGEYQNARTYLQEYLQSSRSEDAPAWAYSFLPIATALNDNIRKWEARQDLINRLLERGSTDKVVEKLDGYEAGTPPIFMQYIIRNRTALNVPEKQEPPPEATDDLEAKQQALRAEEEMLRKQREQEAREALEKEQEEERRRIAEEKEREEKKAAEQQAKIEKDMTVFREGAQGVRLLLGKRQFNKAGKAANAIKQELTTGDAKQKATLLCAICDLMSTLDSFVVRNTGNIDLPAGITRKLGGTPQRATRSKITLSIKHGETIKDWDSISNPLYIKLAEALVKGAKISDTTQGEYYQALAVFSKSIGAPATWVKHYKELAQTKDPDVENELNQYLDLYTNSE